MPLAKKFSPECIIEVSLVTKIENEEPRETLPPPKKEQKKTKLPETIETPPIREYKKIIKEEKTEKKKEPALTVLQEEKTKEMDKAVPERKFSEPPVEQPLQVQAETTSPAQGNGDGEILRAPAGGEWSSMEQGAYRATSTSTFLISTTSRPEVNRMENMRTKEIGSGGEGDPKQTSKIHSSSVEVDRILQQIMRKIEDAKRYPGAARRMGIEGKAIVRFKLKPQGQVEAIEIVESSGSEILDRASLQTVRDAVPLPYKAGWLKVGIVFKIL